MRKAKILSAILITITLLIGVSSMVLGREEKPQYGRENLSKMKDITLDLTELKKYNNIYCIQHNQGLDYYDNAKYKVKSKVVIDGNEVQIYKVSDGKFKLYEEEKVVSSKNNNILAAILSGVQDMEEEMKITEYRVGYGAYQNYSHAQLGLWYYLQTWRDNLFEFEEGRKWTDKEWKDFWGDFGLSSLSGLKDWELNSTRGKTAEKIYNAANECAKYKNYKVTFYVLNTGSLQNLIITYPDDPISKGLEVEKEWLDDDNSYGTRPTEITVKLLENGDYKDKSLVLNESNNWKGKFEDLKRRDENGDEIVYSIEEVEVPRYETKISGSATDGYTITNTLKIDLQVKKEWNDEDDLDDIRPTTIQARLYSKTANSNNKPTDKIVTLSKDDGWAPKSFTDLPLYGANKKLIEYSIEEEVISGYNKPEYDKTVAENGDITYTIKNTHEPNYEGYIEINGNVWKDRPDGKGNDINGVKEDDESGIEGIKVTLKDNDENDLKATYTDENGEFTRTDYAITKEDGTYKIRVNYDNSQKVYKLYEDIEIVRKKLKTAYIEFEYDAMKYTTVAPLTQKQIDAYNENVPKYNKEHPDDPRKLITKADVSKSIENEDKRNDFDKEHTIVTPSTKHPDQWTDNAITAITKDVISFATYEDKTTTTSEEVIKYCDGKGGYKHTNIVHAWDTIQTGTHTCLDCPKTGHTLRVYDIEVETINNVNLGLFEREQPKVKIKSEISKVDVIIRNQQYTYVYKEKTEVTEAEAKKAYDDAYADAIKKGMNEEEARKYAEQEKIKVQFQNKATYTYRRPINPADIAYLNDGNEDAIKVFVTYEVKVENLSTTLPITVHNITNYYDSRYTLITKGWTVNAGDGFNKATNNKDLNIKVGPGKKSQAFELKYQVSLDAIKSLLEEDATLSNAVEIKSYSTQYGEDTLYAEQRTHKKDEADKNKKTVGRAGNSYGGYDYESHPGNAGIKLEKVDYTYEYKDKNGELVTKTYEDVKVLKATKLEKDTDIAPSFVLCKDEAKVLSGTVYEDTDVNEKDKLRLGNGKNDNEKGIANVKVELLKVKEDGSTEPAYLYYKDDDEETGKIRKTQAITYTDSDGNYSFGSNDSEKNNYGYGVLTGEDYKIRFTYGDNITDEEGKISATTTDGIKLNARNFKSTIISNENEIYDLFNADKEEIPDKDDFDWHLKVKDGYSIAVDDMKTRVTEIDDLQYGNFDKSCNMIAYSKQFKTKIEFDQKTESQVLSDGKTLADGSGRLEEELMIFDFGIIERAREDIFVETTINDIELVLANGQSLTSGNPKERNLNYAKAIGFNQNILYGKDAKNALDKQLTIEMDTELIQGATLKTTYAIKATNNSEIDYDYYLGNVEDYDKSKLKLDYYYFGEYKENDPLIESSINYFVDYIDAELNRDSTKDDEKHWTSVPKDDLKDLHEQGFICDETYEKIKGKYSVYTTTKFNGLKTGETRTENLTVSKVLSNQDENIYDNHAEILKLDAKVARTITFEDEKRDVKKYKMGNYVPSLEIRKISNNINEEKEGLHEQDDDRVKIIITPPTGIATHIITYGIIGLIVLIAIGFVIIFIKKKVLTK